jgi:hypothetical protein
VLRKLMTKCQCDTLDQCGKGIFQNMNRDVVARAGIRFAFKQPARRVPPDLSPPEPPP